MVDPFLGQIQAAIQQRIAVRAGIAQKHTRPGSLPASPNSPQYCRFTPAEWLPCLGKSLPSTSRTPSSSPKSFSHFLPVLRQERFIVPRPCTHEGLYRPHRIGVHAFQRQHHWFNRLARQLRQQALEIRVRRLALFTPLKQGTVEPMVVAQRLHERGEYLELPSRSWVWCRSRWPFRPPSNNG